MIMNMEDNLNTNPQEDEGSEPSAENQPTIDQTKSEEDNQEQLTSVDPLASLQEKSYAVQVLDRLKEACGSVIVGNQDVIEKMLICTVAGGHVLLEGVPGVAKTLLAKTLSETIDATFSRIQFTPDLMPADIIGTSVFNMKDSTFEFKAGPIFGNIILIDEINRAPAKTQSALFEVMEERQVSYDGTTYKFDFPFIVIATQNPIEQEGTYRLPEAQLDRFMMKIVLGYPSLEDEIVILDRFQGVMHRELSDTPAIITPEELEALQESAESIRCEPAMLKYIAEIVQQTREHSQLYIGASPRASLAILHCSKVAALFAGRAFVIPDDIQYVAADILNHRIILNADAEMSGTTTHQVVDQIIKQVEVPR